MASVLNVLTRPKRSIHGRKVVITEELAQLLGKEDYNSDSDEEFVPEKSLKKGNKIKSNDEDLANSDDDDESKEEISDESESSLDEDDDSTSSKSDDEKINDVKKETPKKEKKIDLNSIKKMSKPKESGDKKKQKREYNKRKKLHQLKVDELKDENNKILEKLSSRVKQPTNKATSNNGPVVRLDKTLINDKPYPMYIVSSGRNVGIESANIDLDSVKIPREKIPQISDPTGQWLCKLCSNRPNHENLGDLYGPYFLSNDTKGGEEEIWFHEDCMVWTPNVYIKDNKLMGVQDAVSLALKNVKSCFSSTNQFLKILILDLY